MLLVTQYLNMGYLKLLLKFKINQGIDLGAGSMIFDGDIQGFGREFYV